MSNEPLIVQLHWQNRDDVSQTEFVAQFVYDEYILKRIHEVIDRRKDECPEGWQPLVCNQDAPMFVKAFPGGSQQ